MKIITKIFDLIFPPRCVVCDKMGEYICPECQKAALGLVDRAPTEALSADIDGLIYWSSFQNPGVKAIIHAYKYQKLSAMAPQLGQLLAASYKRAGKKKQDFKYIAYIPISKKRLAWRGFNQSELLSKELRDCLKIPLLSGLTKEKETQTQVGLTKKERLRNLHHSFTYSGPKLGGKKILLVDDVVTTGSTLSECARVLKMNGAESVWGITISRE